MQIQIFLPTIHRKNSKSRNFNTASILLIRTSIAIRIINNVWMFELSDQLIFLITRIIL